MRTSVLCVLAISPLLAQGALQLSLARAVDIALAPDGSARIALAEESIRLAEIRRQQARAAFLPRIDGSLQDRNQTVNLRTFGFDFASTTVPVPGFAFPSFVGPFSVLDLRASAQQPVLDFTIIRRYKASRAGIDVAKADRGVTRDTVATQVARAYLAGLRAEEALRSAQASVALSEAVLQSAQSQKDAGAGTGIEVTRAQVQLANDRQRLTVAENERRRAILQLLRAIGLDLSTPVELTGSLAYQPVDTAAIETSLGLAQSKRSEILAQQRREQLARLNLSSVEAERLPALAAFGDYGSIGRQDIGLRPTRTFGITLTVPLFDGGRRRQRRQESLSQLRQEQIRTGDLRDQVELEVRLALDSLRSAAEQVEAAREGLALAQNEVEQARRRYQAGVAIPLEVTDAQTRLDRARDNQVAALYNHNLARLELAAATGNIQEYVHQ
jgi:outer membrane protein TolC